MQRQRHSGLIKMRVETGRPLEGPYVELIRKFERNFGFVWNRFGHGQSSASDARAACRIAASISAISSGAPWTGYHS
jgi:hypothetical protein